MSQRTRQNRRVAITKDYLLKKEWLNFPQKLSLKNEFLSDFATNPNNSFRIFLIFDKLMDVNQSCWFGPQDFSNCVFKWSKFNDANKKLQLSIAKQKILERFTAGELKKLGYTSDVIDQWKKSKQNKVASSNHPPSYVRFIFICFCCLCNLSVFIGCLFYKFQKIYQCLLVAYV